MEGRPTTDGTGTTPGGRGRFTGFDVVGEARHWDPVTTGVVLRRLGRAAPLRFFSAEEEATARPLLDRLLAQDGEPRVPVFELLDARLSEDETDGWRYEDMPADGEAWKASLRHLDDLAIERRDRRFALLEPAEQRRLLDEVRTADRLSDLPAPRVWSLWLRYACAAFYSHPWAWNEIGFGGPAYPRGYANVGLDRREHWERPERPTTDPVGWAARVEQARARHAGDGSQSGDSAAEDNAAEDGSEAGRGELGTAAEPEGTGGTGGR